MDALQNALLQWYHEETLRYAIISLLTVLAVGTVFGLAADVLTRVLRINAGSSAHRKETGSKD